MRRVAGTKPISSLRLNQPALDPTSLFLQARGRVKCLSDFAKKPEGAPFMLATDIATPPKRVTSWQALTTGRRIQSEILGN